MSVVAAGQVTEDRASRGGGAIKGALSTCDPPTPSRRACLEQRPSCGHTAGGEGGGGEPDKVSGWQLGTWRLSHLGGCRGGDSASWLRVWTLEH